MPSLEEILRKTKDKSENIKIVRKPPSIATEDRPYSIIEISPTQSLKNDNKQSKISNQLAINNKPISNQLVTINSNQLVTNKLSISNQELTDKLIEKTNKEPISNPISNQNKESISNQLVTQLVTIQDGVSKLGGLQRKILFYIVDDCIYRGKLVSGFITNETFRDIAKANADTIKTAIQRLIKKSLIKREKGQRGKGGFSSFIITEEVREAVLKEKRNSSFSNQLVTQLVTDNSNQLVTNKDTNKESNVSSSSSILNIKETTTINDEWNFDISVYEKNFGFKLSHIKQLASLNGISAADAEQSLIEFNYDFENMSLPVIKTNKLNFLIGLLRTGNCYVSENYRNEQEQAIKLMAERAEKKKQMLLEEKFITWEASLSVEARAKILHEILPRHLLNDYKSQGMTSQIKRVLLSYYTQTISPKEDPCLN